MYESFYGLAERPFDLSTNPRFLFLSKRHNEALAHLRYGLTGRPGVTLLIGEAGTGKTTLVRAALQPTGHGSNGHHVVHLSNPTLTRLEFYEYLAAGFGFTPEAAQSKTRFLGELESTLAVPPAEQPPIALVVDEAQSLPHELLEEIRLLTNVHSPTGQALTLALVGQPELAGRLNEDRLRQLKQRVALRCELGALDLQETAAYIATRIIVAGGTPEMLFTRDAVSTIHQHSRGIPRTISVICDNALIVGLAAGSKPVSRDLVLEVCRDFQFGDPTATTARQAPASRPSTGTHAALTPAPTPAPPAEADSDAKSKPLFSSYGRTKRFFIF